MNSKLKILIAEDNEMNQKVIRAILDHRGRDYEVVIDGSQAVEKYDPSRFNLILMDCQMPNLDGFAATKKIRDAEEKSKWPRCPIIALTANAMRDDKGKCLAAGMDDFLSKPFKSQDLMLKIEQWVKPEAKNE